MSDQESAPKLANIPNRLAGEASGGVETTNGTSPTHTHEVKRDAAEGTGMAAIAEEVRMLPFTEARARALEEFDRAFLSAALARNAGNIARTARSLGLHRQSLQKLMARRGIKSGRAPAAKST